MQIYVIHAINTADFDDDEAWAAGTSKDLAEAELMQVLVGRWNKMSEEDMEFYTTCGDYYDAFRKDMTILTVRES
jgi:hypothetical protein